MTATGLGVSNQRLWVALEVSVEVKDRLRDVKTGDQELGKRLRSETSGGPLAILTRPLRPAASLVHDATPGAFRQS